MIECEGRKYFTVDDLKTVYGLKTVKRTFDAWEKPNLFVELVDPMCLPLKSYQELIDAQEMTDVKEAVKAGASSEDVRKLTRLANRIHLTTVVKSWNMPSEDGGVLDIPAVNPTVVDKLPVGYVNSIINWSNELYRSAAEVPPQKGS